MLRSKDVKKSEEKRIKKQIKQMLYAYKQNDNDLIKKSAAPIKTDLVDVTHFCTDSHGCQECYADSSSVSGFSDLNLTNSNSEDDNNWESLSSVANKISISDIHDTCDSSQSSESSNEKASFESTDAVLESSKNVTNEIFGRTHATNLNMSDSKYISSDDQSNISDKDTSSVISTPSESQSFDADGNLAKKDTSSVISSPSESQSFDADGNLAKKILDQLKKFNTNPQSGCLKKRKVKESEDIHSQRKMRPLRNQYKPFTEEEVVADCYLTKNQGNSASIDSSPYVSVTAINMQSSTLSEVLGDYRHPTIRNIPTSITNSLSVFPIEINLKETQTNISDNVMLQTDKDINNSTFDESSQSMNEEDIEAFDDNYIENHNLEAEQTCPESDDIKLINPVQIFHKNNNCTVVMKHPAELYIHGKVKVEVLYGVVEIFGYTPRQELCEVYAPNYNHSHCLRTLGKENTFDGLFGKLTSAGLTVAEAEAMVTTIGEYDAIVGLYSLNSRKMDFIDKFASTDLFTKQNKSVEIFLKEASNTLGCSLYLSKPSKHFVEDSSWTQALECGLSTCSRGIVCGGKGTGKSTFLRYYVNKQLVKGPVAVVDLDPGQCEFTVAGNISVTVVKKPLIGPNFTHLTAPEMQLNLGLINPMDNPKRYIEAVCSLFLYCNSNERIRDLPWIVNTMGMCNEVGMKFMSCIILLTQPTFVLQLDSKSAKKRFECQLHPTNIRRLYDENYKNDNLFKNVTFPNDLDYLFLLTQHVESATKNNFSLAPREERYLNFLAYFSELLEIHRRNELLSITPYEVNMRDLRIALNVKVDINLVLKVINGKVVALCQHTEGDNEKPVFTLGDKPLLCHGHGLIRGINFSKELLYVITPLSNDKLSLVNTVLYADWAPELRGQEQQLLLGTAVPYRTDSAYNQRQLMFAPKRRFNPVQLLKMSRKPKLKVS